ncbi:hypothetical protein JCM11641_008131 [Rhodosporidiobolus odoratus]
MARRIPPSSDSEMEVEDVKPSTKSSKPKSSTTTTAAGQKRKSTATETISLSSDSEEDAKPAAKKKAVGSGAKPRDSTGSSSSKKASTSTSTTAANKKKKAKKDDEYEDDESNSSEEDAAEQEEEEDVKPKKKGKTPVKAAGKAMEKEKEKAPAKKSTAAAKKPKKEDEDGAEEKPKPKWTYKPKAGPVAPGSKEIPEGAPNCLAGLTFVFTGELQSLGREEAQDLAKRYGGRVTGAPSSKTSYVVLGSEAGPNKLKLIEKHKLKTLDEDGFLALIAQSESREDDPVFLAQQKKEQDKIKEQAKNLTLQKDAPEHLTQLWTTKYAPQKIAEICGNKGHVEKLRKWLEAWPKSLACNFKKPGPDAMNTLRCCLISGPPGIGKTTSAHLVAKLLGYDILELNASDTRSKKLLEEAFRSKTSDTSLSGFFKSAEGDDPSGLGINRKSVIIMDEVDGMSAGDRGGVGALNALIKKSKVPIIAIANDSKSQKMKPLLNTCFQMLFKRPTAPEIRSRVMSIAFKEGLKLDGKAVDQLVAGSQADIRQIINMLATYKLSAKTLDYDSSKTLARMNEKNMIQTPWTLYNKLFGPQSFSPVSGMTLTDKVELYFQDHSIMPLFVQENYIKGSFAKANGCSGPDLALKKLDLMTKAADAISDGDLVDAMIHGPQQQWSLMPLHGILSCVRPASQCYGSGGGYPSFPAWLGKNSTQGKLQRQLTEIQIRMRLRVSGDKREIRQSYIPALYPRLVNPLQEEGADAIAAVIELMDDYYLSKEEWEAVVELGVGEEYEMEKALKKIDSKVKSAFTRKYNAADHPIPYHKPEAGKAKAKKIAAGGEQPDLEEAFIEEDLPEEDDDDAADSDSSGIGKDKLIKEKGAKKGAKKTAAAPAKAKAGAKAKK